MKTAFRKLSLLGGALAVALSAFSAGALAQADYPNKPIKMIIPFPPGGPTDHVARVLAQKLTEQMGQQVLVENKPGANGNIGNQAVVSAPADGYTLLYNTSSIALSKSLYPKLNYDARKDLEPIALTATIPLVLVVHPSVPAHTVAEFLDYARKNQDKIAYGSAGNGNVTHLGAYLFLQANGLGKILHTPYKGSAPALTDLAGGQVQFLTDTINSALPLIQDNRMRALAVTSLKRSSVLPKVPTLSETVMPNFEVGAWQGLMAPAKTPPAIIKKLNAEVMKALQTPDVREKLSSRGVEPLGSTPEAYGAYLSAEIDRWSKVITTAGIKLD